MTVFEKIEQQQESCKGTPAFFVGEQLKDMCRADLRAADLVLQDLENPSMSIIEAEKKIAAFAKKNAAARVGFCGPADSDRILREFYGIPLPGEAPAEPKHQATILDISSFL